MDAAVIRQRFGALSSQRKTAEQTWQWIERYVVPFRGKFFRTQTSEHEIEWSQRLVYDSTAIDACDTLAASLHGSLTSPQTQWFSLAFRSSELNENPIAAAWLEDAGKVVYDALCDSNFGLEINELYLDLCSFGTGVIVEELEEKNGEFVGLNFQSVPIREAYFEEDAKKQVMRFYRRLQWLPMQIIDKTQAGSGGSLLLLGLLLAGGGLDASHLREAVDGRGLVPASFVFELRDPLLAGENVPMPPAVASSCEAAVETHVGFPFQ